MNEAERERYKAKQEERNSAFLVFQLGMGQHAPEVMRLAAEYRLDVKRYIYSVLLDEIRREGGRTFNGAGIAYRREEEEPPHVPRLRRRADRV